MIPQVDIWPDSAVGFRAWEKCEEQFKRAIELRPTEARYYSNLGGLYVGQKRYEDALVAYQQAIDLRPEDGTLQKNFDTTEMLIKVCSCP